MLIIVKPDGVAAGHASDIFDILRNDTGIKLVTESRIPLAALEVLQQHYSEHTGREFFPSLVEYMQSGEIVASIWEGEIGSIEKVRATVGATDPAKAAPGTIRARFGTSVQRNVIHASDSAKSAEREIKIWFR
jgi:nucleoside-diphosphate kinase